MRIPHLNWRRLVLAAVVGCLVLLNFAGLDYMNSGGIGLLVTLLVRAHRHKQRLLVYGLSEHYREIFEITRLADFMSIVDDEASATMASPVVSP